MHATRRTRRCIAAGGVALIVTNSLLMFWPQRAYGYSLDKILSSTLIDGSHLLRRRCPTRSSPRCRSARWAGARVVALAFTGVVANFVARNLAHDALQQPAAAAAPRSLTNIGKTISLRFTTDELLMAIYTECKKIIDCSLFSIALLDESTNELSFELDVRDDIAPAEGAHPGRRRAQLLGRHASPAAAHRQRRRRAALRREGRGRHASRPSRGSACR